MTNINWQISNTHQQQNYWPEVLSFRFSMGTFPISQIGMSVGEFSILSYFPRSFHISFIWNFLFGIPSIWWEFYLSLIFSSRALIFLSVKVWEAFDISQNFLLFLQNWMFRIFFWFFSAIFLGVGFLWVESRWSDCRLCVIIFPLLRHPTAAFFRSFIIFFVEFFEPLRIGHLQFTPFLNPTPQVNNFYKNTQFRPGLFVIFRPKDLDLFFSTPPILR